MDYTMHDYCITNLRSFSGQMIITCLFDLQLSLTIMWLMFKVQVEIAQRIISLVDIYWIGQNLQFYITLSGNFMAVEV
jgi:hypothetical protein